MKTEVRFLLAIFLMLGVLVGTNLLFPPIPPEELPLDSLGAVPRARDPDFERAKASQRGRRRARRAPDRPGRVARV
jgi:hypothetical protein